MKIIGKIDARKLRKRLGTAERRAKNLRPAMLSIKNIVQSSVEENFVRQGRPKKWTDLAESTKRIRRRRKKWPGMILQVSGQLASSVNSRVDKNVVVVGSNKPYAKIHDEGGTVNHPGTNNGFGKGIPIPPHRIKIPARPFLLFQDDDLDEAQQILLDHLVSGLK